jgi:hypothetical protein
MIIFSKLAVGCWPRKTAELLTSLAIFVSAVLACSRSDAYLNFDLPHYRGGVGCFGSELFLSSARAPKDPRGMLEAALPQYDFNGTSMKPWHMKGSYQLYDEFGNPAQQGSYE